MQSRACLFQQPVYGHSRFRQALVAFGVFVLIPFPATSAENIQNVFAQLRERTLSYSPEIRLAESRLRQTRAALYSAYTKWMPRLDLRLSETTSKDYSALTSGAFTPFTEQLQFRPEETTLSRYALEASVPLYNRGVHVNIERASTDVDLAQAQVGLKRTEISWNLRQLFGNFLLQTYKLATIERSLRIARTNLKEARLRFKLGTRTVIDVLMAQSTLARLESQQSGYEADRIEARAKLADYTGLSVDEIEALGVAEMSTNENPIASAIESFTDLPALTASVQEYPLDLEKLGERLAADSLVYRSYELQSRVERSQAKTVTAENWPDLSLRASLSKQSPQWSETFSPDQHSYSYGLVLTIPLFSGGSTNSTNRERHEIEFSSELKKARLLKEMRNTLLSQLLRIRSLTKSVEALHLSRDRNIEVERLTFRSYQLGRATFLELQQAQEDLLETKIQLAQAQVDLAALIWRFKWNMGVAE